MGCSSDGDYVSKIHKDHRMNEKILTNIIKLFLIGICVYLLYTLYKSPNTGGYAGSLYKLEKSTHGEESHTLYIGVHHINTIP